MRIVDRTTFLALPAGTVYAKWANPDDHSIVDNGDVAVKGDTMWGADWVEEPLIAWPEGCNDSGEYLDAMDVALAGAETKPMAIGDSGCRDGLFDEDQLFAVYSKLEVERLLVLLTWAHKNGYDNA